MLRRLIGTLRPGTGPQAPEERALRLITEGNRAEEKGNMREACERYAAAVDAAPGLASAHLNLGIARQALGETDAAIAAFRAALAIDAADAYALYNLGRSLFGRGELEEAERRLAAALARKPDFFEAGVLLAGVLEAAGRAEEALAPLEAALRVRPGHRGALANRAKLLLELERCADAETALREILAADGNDVDALHDLTRALVAQGQVDEAQSCCEKAILLAPDRADCRALLGAIHGRRDRLEAAIACYREALALDPRLPAQVWNNLGVAQTSLRHLDEAEQSLRRAIALDSAAALYKLNLGLLLLLRGDYAAGLPLLEHRLQGHRQLLLLTGVPRWSGKPAADRTLLLWNDEGLGDGVMMLRYARRLRERGIGKVIVCCDAPLVRLAKRVAGVDEVIPKGEPIAAGGGLAHCPLLSLPLAFGTRLQTIPADPAYLAVPEEINAAWRERLRSIAGRRIGLVWYGSAANRKTHLRNVPPECLAPLFALPGVSIFSLQKDESAAAAERLPGLVDHMDQCADLLDTAALIEQLDLVISVDTSIAHLAGALGKPVWLMNRYESEWRWGLAGDDCPWYPSMRIFRQRKRGNWDSVVAEVVAALRTENAMS